MTKYRLEPLMKMRTSKVEAAARDLAVANAALVSAERARLDAEERRLGHEQAARAVRSDVRTALESSELSVADLRHAADWQVCVDSEQATLAQRVAERDEIERQARAAAERSRSALSQRRADARVIEEHRDAWLTSERKKEDARTEEDVGDMVRARSGPGGDP